MTAASKVNHSASRLSVTTGGSPRFGCQDTVPRRVRRRGHPLRIFAVQNKKFLLEVYQQKERDWKPLADCRKRRFISVYFYIGNAYEH